MRNVRNKHHAKRYHGTTKLVNPMVHCTAHTIAKQNRNAVHSKSTVISRQSNCYMKEQSKSADNLDKGQVTHISIRGKTSWQMLPHIMVQLINNMFWMSHMIPKTLRHVLA